MGSGGKTAGLKALKPPDCCRNDPLLILRIQYY
jgi:hypothetical protein